MRVVVVRDKGGVMLPGLGTEGKSEGEGGGRTVIADYASTRDCSRAKADLLSVLVHVYSDRSCVPEKKPRNKQNSFLLYWCGRP